MFGKSKFAVLLVALVASCNHYAPVSELTDGTDPIVKTHAKPEASEVLATSEARYRSLKSYYFTGKNVVERHRRRETTEEVARVSFAYDDSKNVEASLERNNTRFDISSKGSTSSIILVTGDSDEKKLQMYDDELDCLSSPLLGYGNYFAAGRLSLIAKRKKLGESLYSELTNVTLIGIEPIEGVDCFRIDGDTEGNPYGRTTYWINADSFLVQKYELTFNSTSSSEYFTRFSETYDRVEFR